VTDRGRHSPPSSAWRTGAAARGSHSWSPRSGKHYLFENIPEIYREFESFSSDPYPVQRTRLPWYSGHGRRGTAPAQQVSDRYWTPVFESGKIDCSSTFVQIALPGNGQKFACFTSTQYSTARKILPCSKLKTRELYEIIAPMIEHVGCRFYEAASPG